MRAAWYDSTGPASEVLVVGELPDPQPLAGEVRIALHASGINVGDVKKRAAWAGSPMPYPRVIPHSDGAGVIDAVGAGISRRRLGERVWCYGAQSYRAFGTAAQYVTLPSALAVGLSHEASYEVGACLGIPGITAHRALFADGSIDGRTVLVSGALGAVGSVAVQLARWRGARVLATVRRPEQQQAARDLGAEVFVTREPGVADSIRRIAPDGVDRIVEVAFDANAELNSRILAGDGAIASYASTATHPQFPYWPLAFANATIRLLGSDDFPAEAKAQAAADLTDAVAAGALQVSIARRYPLEEIAAAHDAVAAGSPGRVVLTLRDSAPPPQPP